MKKRIGIVGSTGSIGQQAVDVIERNPDRFEVVFITTHVNVGLMAEQAKRISPKLTCVTGSSGTGSAQLADIIRSEELDLVLVAAVGAAGIIPTYECAKRGIDIALANKESIVAAGRLILDTAKANGAQVIPVDSEHSAIYQCLMGQDRRFVANLILTASGGPFRRRPADAFGHVSVEEALRHPNWTMGNKITVDSATMMNKGLELIEARYLFDVAPENLKVVIHPESIIHSMVAFSDGSMLAQLGSPDMRVPISFALGFPERLASGVEPLDMAKISELSFSRPDLTKYTCLKIAMDVLLADKNMPMIVMNAANEIAVERFLRREIGFTDIPRLIETVLGRFDTKDVTDAEAILSLDLEARRVAAECSGSL